MRKLTSTLLLPLILLLISLTACNKSHDKSTVNVKMTDSPASFSALLVNVDRVDIHKSGASDNDGWETIEDQPIQVNIMNLTNGQAKLLGSNQIASGNYDMIRLILGTGNKIVIGGTEYALTVPSGAQSGIKIHTNLTVNGGETSDVLLDFNASQSIQLTGNLNYILNPVISVVNPNTDGNIKGSVDPAMAKAAIIASNDQDTTATYADTTSGKFTLVGLKAGTYTVQFFSNSSAYNDTTLSNIQVNAGSDTDMGTIKLSQNTSGNTTFKNFN